MRTGIFLLTFFVLSLTVVSADACDLSITMVNQDPYPANPGEYVKLVFQVSGVETNDCGDITFELLQKYPLEFDPTEASIKKFKRVDYLADFESSILIPYKVRVDKAALDGSNEMEVSVKNENDPPISAKFNLEVENTYADFEAYIKDFDYSSNELTLEILNIENSDVEALVIEIPKQDTIDVRGSNKVIVGDLDSNDYTTADFEALPSNGDFNIIITYSDAQSLRRSVEKTVSFDSSYFTNRKADSASQLTLSSILFGIFLLWLGLVVLLIIFMFTRWLIMTVFGIKKRKKLGK